MRELNNIIDLRGQFEEITIMDLRKHVGEILTQVSLGKTFLITKTSKPIAFLSYLPKIGKPNVNIVIEVNKNKRISYGL